MEGPTHSTSFEGGVELGVADEQLQQQPHMQPSSSSLTARKKTINDFAIHSIFGEFVKAAEQKLAVILSQPFELREVDIASYIRFGIDRSFDKIIAALGSIAKHRPRAVIDAVMIWRRSKGDPVSDLEFIKSKIGEDASAVKIKEAQVVLRERKTLASNFILARALIEIVLRLNSDGLSGDLGDKLEEMVFNQLVNFDSEVFTGSLNHQSSLAIFAELMGAISIIRFPSVVDRFVNEIRSNNGAVNETKVDLIIRSMRYFRLSLYPMGALDESVDFLQTLAELFNEAHSASLKHSYAQLLYDLLTPIGAIAVAEVNIPAWAKSVESIYAKCNKMLLKPRHTIVALPLATSLLCISRKEFFSAKWFGMVELCFLKMKDKQLRHVAITCIIRLMWIYLYRCSDPMVTTIKKLDVLIKTLFPPGRKYIVPSEISLEPIVQLIQLISLCYPDYSLKNIIFYLLNTEISSFTIDNLAPERFIIAFRSFISLMDSREGQRPPFPLENDALPSGLPLSYGSSKAFDSGISRTQNIKNRFPAAFDKICLALGKIIPVLDTNFGNFLILDDKQIRAFSSSGSLSSSITGSGSDYSTIVSRDKQVHFELIKTWLSLLPRIWPSNMEDKDVIGIISRYMAHVDPEINASAQDALLRICNECPDKRDTVIRVFCNFIQSIHDRFSDLIEKCLAFLLRIWEMWMDSTNNDSAQAQIVIAHIHPLETAGLLYLCSYSPYIRKNAIAILDLAKQIIVKYSIEKKSLIEILSAAGSAVLSIHDQDYITPADSNFDRSSDSRALLRLAASDLSVDNHLWTKCFATVIKMIFQSAPSVIQDILEFTSQRLMSLHSAVVSASEPAKTQNITISSKLSLRSVIAASEDMVAQWKFYLILICATISNTEQPARKIFFKKSPAKTQKVDTAREIIQLVLPLLVSESSSVRIAVVLALGNLNHQVFPVLIEELQSAIKSIIDDMRSRYIRGSSRRVKKLERLRAEITHILYLSANYFQEIKNIKEENKLITFTLNIIKELGGFLSDFEVQNEWDHQMLRYYFCSYVERFYASVSDIMDPTLVVPFDLRFSLFKLFEEWCGYGQRGSSMRQREAKMILGALEQVKDIRERGALTSAMEEQRKALEFAALKAMASLCRGPLLSSNSENNVSNSSFDIAAIFEWLEAIFNSVDERIRPIAKNALESLLTFNQNVSSIWNDVALLCYQGLPSSAITQGYFLALVNILQKIEYPIGRAKLINLALYKLGDEFMTIRRSAITLLRVAQARFNFPDIASEFEVAVISPLSITYKQAQVNISTKISRLYTEITYEMVSEIFYRLDVVDQAGQRDMMTYLLPWLEKIELTLDNRFGELSHLSYLVLSNLFYVTVRYGNEVEREIEHAWAILALRQKNLYMIVQFLIHLGLEKRNSLYAIHAKKIILYMGRTEARDDLIDVLIAELTPKSLIPQKKQKKDRFQSLNSAIYHVSNLDSVFKGVTRTSVLSKGQLVMIFFVDFVIEYGLQIERHLPLLFHVGSVELDHFNPLVRDHSKMLLCNLLHFIGHKSAVIEQKKELGEIVQRISTSDFSMQNNSVDAKEKLIPFPNELKFMIGSIAKQLSNSIRQKWGDCAIFWATNCPVRHVACRSLHLYQGLEPDLTLKTLTNLLDRLSTTISDPGTDVQGFALEILRTVSLQVEKIDENQRAIVLQLFWSCLSAMNSCHQDEYLEALLLTEKILAKINLNDSSIECSVLNSLPSNSDFNGIQPAILRGLCDSSTCQIAVKIIHNLIGVEADRLVDCSERRTLYTILASVPMLIENLSKPENSDQYFAVAARLSAHCASRNLVPLSRLMDTYSKKRIRSVDDFLRQLTSLLNESFGKDHAITMISFFVSLLKNGSKPYRSCSLKLLKNLLPQIGRKQINLQQAGNDLIRPFFYLFKTEFAQEALEVLDEILWFSDQQKQEHDSGAHRFIIGNKAITRFIREANISMMDEYNMWPFDEKMMETTRLKLCAAVAKYGSLDEKQVTSPQQPPSAKPMEEMSFDIETDQPMEPDDLIATLEALDGFFSKMISENDSSGAIHSSMDSNYSSDDDTGSNAMARTFIDSYMENHADDEDDEDDNGDESIKLGNQNMPNRIRDSIISSKNEHHSDSSDSDGSFALEAMLEAAQLLSPRTSIAAELLTAPESGSQSIVTPLKTIRAKDPNATSFSSIDPESIFFDLIKQYLSRYEIFEQRGEKFSGLTEICRHSIELWLNMLEEFLRFMRKHLFIVSGFPAELYSKAIMARIKSFRSINLREFREFLDELSVENDGASNTSVMNDANSKRANLILQAVGKQLNTWTGSYRIILDTEKEILEALEHDQTTDISTELRQKLNDYLVSLGQLAGLTLTIGLAVIDCAQPVLTEKQQTSNNDILTTLRRQIEQKSIPHQAGIAENQLELPSPPLPIAQQRLSELDLCALDRGDSKPVLSLPENVSKFHLTNVQSTPAELLADITAGRAIISTPPSIPLRQRSSSLHSSTSSVAIDPNDVNVGTPPPIIPRRTSSARRQ